MMDIMLSHFLLFHLCRANFEGTVVTLIDLGKEYFP